MRSKVFVIVLATLVLVSGLVFSVDGSFLKSTILPGDFFYFTKQWIENLGTVFTFGEVEKAKRMINFSNRRLKEVEKIAKKERYDILPISINEYIKSLERVEERIGAVRERGLEESNLIERFLDSGQQQKERLNNVYDFVINSSKEVVAKAIDALDNSIERYSTKPKQIIIPEPEKQIDLEEEENIDAEGPEAFDFPEAPLIPMPYF